MASAAFDLVSLKRSGKRAIEGITSNKKLNLLYDGIFELN